MSHFNKAVKSLVNIDPELPCYYLPENIEFVVNVMRKKLILMGLNTYIETYNKMILEITNIRKKNISKLCVLGFLDDKYYSYHKKHFCELFELSEKIYENFMKNNIRN